MSKAKHINTAKKVGFIALVSTLTALAVNTLAKRSNTVARVRERVNQGY